MTLQRNIINFLDWLENERHVNISSRNVRLSAVHSFVRYIQPEDPEHVFEYKKILNIKTRNTNRQIFYLSVNKTSKPLLTQQILQHSKDSGIKFY